MVESSVMYSLPGLWEHEEEKEGVLSTTIQTSELSHVCEHVALLLAV